MSGDVTKLLQQWGDGDSDAFEALIPLVYDELRKLAAAHLRQERGGHTLQPTGLVHEAYMRLTDRPTGNWKGRAQFYAVASQVIRRVLVDHARGRLRQKRGGGARHLVLIDSGVDWPIERSIQITPARGRPRRARRDGCHPGQDRRTALLHRPHHRGGRRGPGPVAGHGEARLELGAGLAAARTERPESGACPPRHGMNPEQWQRVREVLEPALEIAPEARAEWLDARCPEDLREEVEALIAASATDDTLLDAPVFRADSPIEPGTELGPYVIEELVGVGGMGVVYRAEDTRLRRTVAVKLLTFGGREDDMLAEARSASALNHPNIVTIHDVLEYRDAPVIVMEFVDGLTLEDAIEGGPLKSGRIARPCAAGRVRAGRGPRSGHPPP